MLNETPDIQMHINLWSLREIIIINVGICLISSGEFAPVSHTAHLIALTLALSPAASHLTLNSHQASLHLPYHPSAGSSD